MRRVAVGLVVAAIFAAAARADTASDALVRADLAHGLGYTGKGVTVAVLDTGIAGFANSVVAEHCIGACASGAAEADGAGTAQDDQGHGTEVAGILLDVAPDAKLVVVKVADRNGRSSTAQIQAGLDWVRTHHPEVRIVNVSLAGDIPLSGDCTNLTPALASYAASVDALRAQGTLVFAASGNNGRENGLPAPACFPETVAVGAVYSHTTGAVIAPDICRDAHPIADQVACWSNASSELDLLAPGAPIATIGLDGRPTTFAGTSAASAVAAGAAALLLQADRSLTAGQLESLLEQTGVPITDPRRREQIPRVDLETALARVLGHSLTPPRPPRVDVGASSAASAQPSPSASCVAYSPFAEATVSSRTSSPSRASSRAYAVVCAGRNQWLWYGPVDRKKRVPAARRRGASVRASSRGSLASRSSRVACLNGPSCNGAK